MCPGCCRFARFRRCSTPWQGCVPARNFWSATARAWRIRAALACHLGWILDAPCIGVAKSRLIGSFADPEQRRGAATPLRHDGEIIGAALRSRVGAKPVFVSIGHRVGLASAVALAMACTGGYRLLETTRHAHRLASRRLGLESQGEARGPEAEAGRAPRRIAIGDR